MMWEDDHEWLANMDMKASVLICLKELSRHSLGGSEENDKLPQ